VREDLLRIRFPHFLARAELSSPRSAS